MVLASHLIFSAYGFWLPNEERGSWSERVRSYELFLAGGPATKVGTHRSVAAKPYDRERKRRLQNVLRYPPVRFDGLQARAIGRGFAEQTRTPGYRVLACAVLSDHAHLVVGRHHYKAEQVANLLKGAASLQLVAEGLHPMHAHHAADLDLPSMWASGLWKVFLNDDAAIRRAIRYVENNPLKAGLRRQRWKFVTSWDGGERGPRGRR